MSIPSLVGNAQPLVGRERDLRVLREHLAAALSGQGSLVLIGGEAGIGKTALTEALCQEAMERGALVLTGRCFDLTETPPYGPWLYLFARYRPTDQLPRLPAPFAQPGTVGEVASRATLFNAVLDFFRTVSDQTPLVVLLDDLHWADTASFDLLRFLAQSVATLPMLLLVTYRSDELTRRNALYPLLPLLVRESLAERLDLRALTDNDIHRVVAARFPLPEVEADRLVVYLRERAEGNPFFVGELLRTLEETGALREAEGRWHLGDVGQARVPPLLRQVIDGRVARLGEEARDLLAVAAVIGQEVPLDVWAAVAAVEEDALLEIIERGVTAGLLVEAPGGERVQFAHALVREALYESVLATRRRRLHRAVAETLSQARNPDADAVADHFRRAGDVRAAEWLLRAGSHAGALFSDRIAVDRLEAALALCDEHDLEIHLRSRVTSLLAGEYRFIEPERAIHYVGEAMRLAEQLDDRPLKACLLVLRAWLRNDAQQMEAGLADLRAGQAIADDLRLDERAPRASDPAYERDAWAGGTLADFLARGEGRLTEYLAIVGRYMEARAVGERFVANAPVGTDPRLLPRRWQMALGNAYHGLHMSYLAQGEPDLAAHATAEALRYYSAAQWDMMCGNVIRFALRRVLAYRADEIAERERLAAQQDEFHARWLTTLGIAAPRLGQLPILEIEGRWAEARALASGPLPGFPSNVQIFARLMFGTIARAQGEAETAWSVVRMVLPGGPAITVNINFLAHTPMLRLGAALTLDAGDLAAAHAWLTAHDELLAGCEAVLGLSEGHALWARYFRQAGDAAQARQHAERALAHATEPRQPLALIAAHRLLGELDTEAGQYEDAAAQLDAALSLADACQAPYERALTLLAMAELRAAPGNATEAATLIDAVRAICEPLGAKPALARADALLSRLATPAPSRAPSYPAGLTAREVEVLRLVARGLMNSEIAERLFLSERTVEQHLRSVYNKLGSSSRAAASAFAVQHGLTTQ